MATTNSTPNQTLLIAAFVAFFLLLFSKVHSSPQLTFDIDKFVPNQPNLIFQGAASVSSKGALQLTDVSQPPKRSIGRALYAAPFQIWDNGTGEEASFLTLFSFVVKANDPKKTADGLTFFIAPANSQIPPGSSAGLFGLFNNSDYNAANQIFAVEFDTYFGSDFNPWDPDFIHVGVDVNSIKSIKTEEWDFRNGEVYNVIILYQASTKSLSVSLEWFDEDESHITEIITTSVDLKSILPEWVSLGFSAGVGDPRAFETHDIVEWYFTTEVRGSNNVGMMKNIMSAAHAHSSA